MFVTFIFSIIILILLYILHFQIKFYKLYWKKRGVPYHNKAGGPYWQYLTKNKSMFQILKETYHKFKDEPAVGLGSFTTPALYVRDPTNIHHVLQSDFPNFNHRGLALSDGDILAHNILLMHGPAWKLVRKKLSPIFTAAKLKNMYYIIEKSAQDLLEYLQKNPEKLKKDTYNTLTLFCNAAIGAAVFGITSESTFESPLHQMVRQALTPSTWKNIKFAISGISDLLVKVMRLKLFGNHEEFFIGIMKQVLRKREQEDTKKHDFPEICVNLQRSGKMKDADTGLELEPTDELLAAQAFFFFLAGVEPTAAGMFGLMVELGRHPEIQDRVCKEIDEVFEKYNGELCYDAIMEMVYLGRVLDESLRMHPPIGFLTRQCVAKSVLPVGDIPVERDTKIFTPIYDMHYDPKYFPNPEVFDPERFSSNGMNVNDFAYMPFGKGNRICIGIRYARLQLLTGVVHVLRKYTMKTIVYNGSIEYKKNQMQVRLKNVDVQLIPKVK